jgi:hypothetical protein
VPLSSFLCFVKANELYLNSSLGKWLRDRLLELCKKGTAVARRLYQALIAQDRDRLITLRDGSGRVAARHDPRPEQGDPEIAS